MVGGEHTLDDAVVVFRALDRRHAAVLLSQLEIVDAQLLLAAAAKRDDDDGSRLSNLLASLQQAIDAHPRAATAVNDQSIEQLLMLPNQQIKTLLASVSTAHWAPALSQASAEVTQHVLSNVASPVSKLLSAEIDSFPGGEQAAANARTNIIAVAERLRFLNAGKPRKRAG